MKSAFTTTSTGIVNRLKNQVSIYNGEKSVQCTALWDTGATNSCISHDVVSALSLISTGNTTINTPSGASVVDTYMVDVVLPNDVTIKDLTVVDSEIGKQNIGMLIGMDIINRGDFSVSNYKGSTSFTLDVV